MTFFNGFCCYSNSITQLNLHASLFFENEVVGGVKGGEGNIMTTHSTLSLCQHLVWWAFLEDIISLCSSGILFFNYFCFVQYFSFILSDRIRAVEEARKSRFFQYYFFMLFFTSVVNDLENLISISVNFGCHFLTFFLT